MVHFFSIYQKCDLPGEEHHFVLQWPGVSGTQDAWQELFHREFFPSDSDSIPRVPFPIWAIQKKAGQGLWKMPWYTRTPKRPRDLNSIQRDLKKKFINKY